MRISYVVFGANAEGQIVETWKLHGFRFVDMAVGDLRPDAAIKRVVVVALCRACGAQRLRGECLNAQCPTRRQALPRPKDVAHG